MLSQSQALILPILDFEGLLHRSRVKVQVYFHYISFNICLYFQPALVEEEVGRILSFSICLARYLADCK